MKVMLTSFGIEQSISPGHFGGTMSMFHRMPPVSFLCVNEAFVPDYDLLLLCNAVVMDGDSFERLVLCQFSELGLH